MAVGELAERLCGNESIRSLATRISRVRTAAGLTIAEIVSDERVPCAAALRYTETGLSNYAKWIATWRSQAESGLRELLPWLRQWHEFGEQSVGEYLTIVNCEGYRQRQGRPAVGCLA